MPGSSVRLVFRTLLTIAAAWLLCGAVLRITGIRDRFDGLAVIYYTMPWPIVALGAGGYACILRTRGIFGRYVFPLMMLGCFVGWLTSSWMHGEQLPTSEDDCRVMLWNVANNEAAIDRIAAKVSESSPDLIGFAEAGNHLSNAQQWATRFPEYQVARLKGQMLCMSRTPLNLVEEGSLGNGSWYAINQTTLGGHEVYVLQTDINAKPLRPRSLALGNLAAKIRQYQSMPLIVMGDFNTPRESYYLDPLRQTLQHAFETRGAGYAETWPLPLPVLSLDQMWFSREFVVAGCEQGWSRDSDHRSVLTRARFTAEAAR